MRRLLPALLLALVAAAAAAAPPTGRVLLAVASHRGHDGEAALRYAERDARRVLRVFAELGGVEAEDLLLSVDPGPADLRPGLELAAARLAARAAAGDRASLLFYYSGHADRRALHLGAADFAHDELRRTIAATGAGIRLLVLDACESGGITRNGVTPVEPLALSVTGEQVEGEVVITSSAADEASLESDALGGSFFTHHLVAGLRGAADRDDGRVTLAEVYTYAYRRTLADTGATRAGPLHPSFALDLRGLGDLVLTEPGGASSSVAHVRFPPDAAPWMVLEFREGPAVASLPPETETTRLLALSPGTYWLRRRGEDALEEARVELRPGETLDAQAAGLSRVAYAAVVRKGLDPDRTHAHTVAASALLESPGLDGVGSLAGAALAYRLDLPWLSVRPSLTVASGSADGDGVPFSHDELTAGLAAVGVFDLGGAVLMAGPEVRWIGVRQRFAADEARGGRVETERLSCTVAWGTLGLAEIPLWRGLSAQLAFGLDLVRLALEGEGVEYRPRGRALVGLGLTAY